MDQIVAIMLPPLVACLILTGIHTYLGLHVVSRGVIFVDLALAQIAALGSTFAFLMGFDPKSPAGYFYSLSFAFLGAAIFSLSRLKDNRVPQEALIGIAFAVASSAAILIADRAPQGAEHVEEMLTGAILWITWPTILKTLGIYSLVGLFHIIFRKQFLLISMDPAEAERRGMSVRWWDFLFYMSFGFVITSSVAIAGVLLVFSFLIIPSVIAMLYSREIGTRLIIGWVSGTLVSFLGLYSSYTFDLPSGPAVVCSFGAFLILSAVIRYLQTAPDRGKALLRLAVGSAALLLFLFVATHFEPGPSESAAEQLSPLQELQNAIAQISTESTPDEAELAQLKSEADRLRKAVQQGEITLNQNAVKSLSRTSEKGFIPVILAVAETTRDPWTRFQASKSLIDLGAKEGIHQLIFVLKEEESPIFLRSQALSELTDLMGTDFSYDPSKSPQENERAINQMEVWWHQNADVLRWDAGTRAFHVPDAG